jgi:hypothetical protein
MAIDPSSTPKPQPPIPFPQQPKPITSTNNHRSLFHNNPNPPTSAHNHHTRKPTTDSTATLIVSADCAATQTKPHGNQTHPLHKPKSNTNPRQQTQTHNHHTRKPTTDSTATLVALADCAATQPTAHVDTYIHSHRPTSATTTSITPHTGNHNHSPPLQPQIHGTGPNHLLSLISDRPRLKLLLKQKAKKKKREKERKNRV